jgi:hypothetical protein
MHGEHEDQEQANLDNHEQAKNWQETRLNLRVVHDVIIA